MEGALTVLTCFTFYVFDALFDALAVFTLEGILEVVEGTFDLAADLGRDLVAVLAKLLFSVIDDGIALVFEVDGLPALLVVGGVRVGLALHLVDLILGEAAAAGDGDAVFLAGAQVFGADAENAVDVHLE